MDKIREWQKKHPDRMRAHKLKWYYKNRIIINMMFSKPKSPKADIADIHYAETHPEG